MLAGSSPPASGAVPAPVAQVRESIPGSGAALGLHEEISHPGSCKCSRWPEKLALREVGTGEQIKGRCSSPNKCEGCAKLAAIENAEVLQLDAMTNEPPTIVAVVGTRSTVRDPQAFWKSREQVQRALKRRWPRCEYVALVEFTTGYGPRSGGRRRPHWNLLLKGVPVEDVDQVRDVVTKVWCAREDAEPHAQYVAAIGEMGGLSRYLAMHFQKESQKPPAGWKGHRFLHSRGYFDQPLPKVRELARESLRRKRVRWKVERSLPPGVWFDALEVAEWVDQAVERDAARRYELVQLQDELGAVVKKPHRRAVRRSRSPA